MYSLVNLKIANNFKSNTYLFTEKAKMQKRENGKSPQPSLIKRLLLYFGID